MKDAYRLIEHRIMESDLTRRTIAKLCKEIGPRPMCSPAMKEAAEYVAAEFRTLGLQNVRCESVSLPKWTPGTSTITLDDGSTVPNIQFSFNEDCSVGGRLLDVRHGLPRDLDRLGKMAEGCVLLMFCENPGGSPRGWNPLEKVRLAGKHGARGIIFMDARPVFGAAGGNSTVGGDIAAGVQNAAENPAEHLRAASYGGLYAGVKGGMPVTAVPFTEGVKLKRRPGETGVRIDIKGNRIEKGEDFNVVGDLGPSEQANHCLLSTHLDTVYKQSGRVGQRFPVSPDCWRSCVTATS